jgi:HrpA-like RNA helicase/predicted RNA-binding protein with RPS1 domain
MTALRGTSASRMRRAVCKDCQREIEGLHRAIEKAQQSGDGAEVAKLEAQLVDRQSSTFSYTEHSAGNVVDRGGSRSDRCPEHRRKHRTNIQGMAVAYVDLTTIGEAVGAREPDGPTGPLGGLGPMPGNHEPEKRSADLAKYEFGMNDRDIVEILELLRHKRVLVLKAGTGTGKSTFGPYRLMDPPTTEDLDRLGILDGLRRDGIESRDASGEVRARYELPASGPYRLTELGQIVVTEPRVAAATGVSRFVGEKLAMGCTLKQCSVHGPFNPKAHPDGPEGKHGPSCPDFDNDDESKRCTRNHVGPHPWPKQKNKCVVTDCYSHVGPGFPIGYQVSGDRNHDENCQLVFVTDGTMINWLREGRLSRIGTVIVDEAHERSTNIDFIMGFLQRDLEKYPHLRVIITSATFEPKFYEAFFGGPDVVAVKEVPAVKTVGYGMPLFPELDQKTAEMSTYLSASTEAAPRRWPEEAAWPLVDETEPNTERFIRKYWPILDRDGKPLRDSDGHELTAAKAPKLKAAEVTDRSDVDYEEDLWETTRALMPLRFGAVDDEKIIPSERWKQEMPTVLADFIVRLTRGLDEAAIFGDILSFLPTAKTIEEACDRIRNEVGDVADVCGLVSSLPDDAIDKALSARRKGDRRKIVVSTNLAETSLTVEGVRFVVDTGLIAQSYWDANLASGGVGTKLHSKAGIKQRWGRVGRKAPGWVFPLYTKAQYAALAEDTPPGSARENLENVMMTARMGGIDDVKAFPWPAAFPPDTDEFGHIALDASAKTAREDFLAELDRADAALRSNGAVDEAGHPTSFGKELTRFSGLGSAASAMAIMYADRLGCVPEVATILALLENARLLGRDGLFQDSYDWPDEWRVEAANRHRGIASVAEDDAHLVLLVSAAWERADERTRPWQPSERRRAWARQWWVSNDVLLAAAKKRQAALSSLSPAMKEEVKRFVEPALLDRARGVLARTLKTFEFRRDGDAYLKVGSDTAVTSADCDAQVDSAANDSAEATAQTTNRYVPEADQLVKVNSERVIALRRREGRTDLSISSLVRVPPAKAITSDGGNAASSVADAMAMLLAFRKHARPDPKRDVALELIRRWPIGARLNLPGTDGVLTLADAKRPVDPFARPRTEAEKIEDGIWTRKSHRRRRSARASGDGEEDLDATEEDAKGELGLRQRSGVDDEAIERRAIRDVDASIDADIGCGECDACRVGRKCTDPPPPDERRAFDAIKSAWLAPLDKAVKSALESTTFCVAGDDRAVGWFEITGYQDVDSDQPKILLERDWRSDQSDADPARHHEVEAGSPIEVSVGGWVSDHTERLRVFNRTDGLGRFLLREAPPSIKTQLERNQIAVSLSSGAQGLLELLKPGQAFTATVVPARAEGCFTITLLETLYQHLRQASRSLPQVPVDPDNPKKGMVGAYPALVAQPPNDNGWLAFRLLFHDSKRGIHHLVAHKPTSPAEKTALDGDAPSAGTPFSFGSKWMLRLKLAESALAVGGMDLDRLDQIEKDSAYQLWLGVPKKDRDRDDDGHDDGAAVIPLIDLIDGEDDQVDPIRKAPNKMIVRPKKGHPLSRVLAAKLAELDDTPEWQNEVWAFWARSHHMVTERPNGVLPGNSSAEIEVSLVRTEVEEETPAEHARKKLSAVAAAGGMGLTVRGIVTDVQEQNGARLELDGGAEAWVPISELSWTWLEDARDAVQLGQKLEVKITEIDPAAGTLVASVRALIPEPYVEYKASHAAGDPVDGVVQRVSKTHVNVLLYNGAPGVVHASNLRWGERVEDATTMYEPGVTIHAAILEFDDEKRQVELSIKARLPEPYVEYKASHAAGDLVDGVVQRVSKTHVNVRLSNGAPGVVHASNLRWGERVEDATTMYEPGVTVHTKILEFDDEKRQVELSIKARLPDPFPAFMSSHDPNDTVTGMVTKLLAKSAFVDLGGGVRGSIFIRHVTGYALPTFSGHLVAGERYAFRIMGYDLGRKQVNLARYGIVAASPSVPPRAASQPKAAQPPPRQVVAPPRRATPPSRPATSPPVARTPKSTTAQGATVDEATRSACRALGLTVSQVRVVVLDEGARGVFRKKRPAKVRVTERI